MDHHIYQDICVSKSVYRKYRPQTHLKNISMKFNEGKDKLLWVTESIKEQSFEIILHDLQLLEKV